MKQLTSFFHQLFDRFPEPALLVQEQEILCRNPAAEHTFSLSNELPPALAGIIPPKGGVLQGELPEGSFHITASLFQKQMLLLLLPLEPPAPKLPFLSLPRHLRQHLSTLSAATERLNLPPFSADDMPGRKSLLATQTQAIYRLLRITKQMELSQNNWEATYPLRTINLTTVFLPAVDELKMLL